MNSGGADPISPAERMREMTRRAVQTGAPVPPRVRRPRTHRRVLWLIPVCALLLPLAGWLVLRPAPQRLPMADEAALLATPPDAVHTFRLAPAPAILVLTFPSLGAQARALNRVGAFVEKAGAPHDRVLTDPEMSALIDKDHETAENFYYGHDYRAVDMDRFFAVAARDGIALHPEEQAVLRVLHDEESAHRPARALISLPPLSESEQIDPAARAAILRHEISHGVYFTDPVYAAYTQHFWTQVLSADQRARFRTLLAAQGYDTGDEDLTANETQAYLVHTPDVRYFSGSALGMNEAEVQRLREVFVSCMPIGWLRDRTDGARQACTDGHI